MWEGSRRDRGYVNARAKCEMIFFFWEYGNSSNSSPRKKGRFWNVVAWHLGWQRKQTNLSIDSNINISKDGLVMARMQPEEQKKAEIEYCISILPRSWNDLLWTTKKAAAPIGRANGSKDARNKDIWSSEADKCDKYRVRASVRRVRTTLRHISRWIFFWRLRPVWDPHCFLNGPNAIDRHIDWILILLLGAPLNQHRWIEDLSSCIHKTSKRFANIPDTVALSHIIVTLIGPLSYFKHF